MTNTAALPPLPEPELDEDGNLRPFTADQCLAVYTNWAAQYPSARFVVVAISPDGSDIEDLGWGLALPDHAFTHLPTVGMSGKFRSAHTLLDMLRRVMDARLIWVDPEPEHWTDGPED